MIGERVRKVRKEKGMTQIELAKRLGYISASTIAHIEDNTNDVPLAKVKKLADALGTTPEYLLGWEQELQFDKYLNRMSELLSRLDEVDRAKIEERVSMLLESEKYE